MNEKAGIRETWKNSVGYTIRDVDISSNGEYVVAGSFDYSVYVFDGKGHLLWSYRTGDTVRDVAISFNGRYVIAGSYDGHVYYFTVQGKLLWKHRTRGSIRDVSISANGDFVVVGSNDHRIYFFDREGNLLWERKTLAPVYCVAMSTNGEYVAAGSLDALAYYLDREGKMLWKFRTESSVRDVEVSADGSMVAVGSYDKNLYYIKRSGLLAWKCEMPNPVDKVAISPDGEVISTGSDGKVFLHDKHGMELWKNDTGTYTIRGLQISSIGDSVVAGTRDCDLIYFDRKGQTIWKYRANSWVEAVAVSSNGRYIVAGTSKGNLFYFDSLEYFQEKLKAADNALRLNINYGLDVSDLRRRLNDADLLMKDRQYIKAMHIAQDIARASGLRIREEKETPDISIIGKARGDFVSGKWKEVRLEIVNVGKATALDIRFWISGPARQKGASASVIERLAVGRMQEVKSAIMPLVPGESVLKFLVMYNDFGGREFSKESRIVVNVLDSSEKPDEGKIQFFKVGKERRGMFGTRRLSTHPRCPVCHKRIMTDWHLCPYCGTSLRTRADDDTG